VGEPRLKSPRIERLIGLEAKRADEFVVGMPGVEILVHARRQFGIARIPELQCEFFGQVLREQPIAARAFDVQCERRRRS
jgi:hypothetical protein